MLYLLRNNILNAIELRYSQRVAKRDTRRFWRWVNKFIITFMLFMSLLLYGGELAGALTGRDATPIGALFGKWTFLFPALVFVGLFLVMGRTQRMMMRAIARDKRNSHSWENLVITGIDARRYVLAKWWAVVRTSWREYLLLGVLRAGAVAWTAAAISRENAFRVMSYYSYNNLGYTLHIPSALDIVLIGVMGLVLSMVHLPMAAAMSLDSALDSPHNGNTPIGAFMRGAVHIAVIIALGFAIFWTIFHVQWRLVPDEIILVGVVGLLAFWSLADNGAVMTGLLAIYYWISIDSTPIALTGIVLAAFGATLVVYTLMTMLWLRMAQWTAWRYHLVSPREM
jgi:hypothetical protein